MIVVDENIHSRAIMASIAGWYRGQVISVTQLRPHSIIRDDAIPALLHPLNQPTFVTTNVDDFWQVIQPHPDYCLVCLSLPKERNREAPNLLRALLGLPQLKTKARRMGKILKVSPTTVLYYEHGREVMEMMRW